MHINYRFFFFLYNAFISEERFIVVIIIVYKIKYNVTSETRLRLSIVARLKTRVPPVDATGLQDDYVVVIGRPEPQYIIFFYTPRSSFISLL